VVPIGADFFKEGGRGDSGQLMKLTSSRDNLPVFIAASAMVCLGVSVESLEAMPCGDAVSASLSISGKMCF
jgi:hypothetical protein